MKKFIFCIFAIIFAFTIWQVTVPTWLLTSAQTENIHSEWLFSLRNLNTISLSDYQNNYQNSLSYRFAAGLTQLGYATNWYDIRPALLQFRRDHGVDDTQVFLTKIDINTLDNRLAIQEKNTINNAIVTLQAFPKTQFIFPPNCGHEPLLSYLSLLAQSAEIFSEAQRNQLKTLKFGCGDPGPRGEGGNGEILIQTSHLLSHKKFLSLFIHEMIHILDEAKRSFPNKLPQSHFSDTIEYIFPDDPALEFYRISWKDAETHASNTRNEDFVSGYAATDPFEDIAESATVYVMHGQNFKFMAETNLKLAEKYRYIKTILFAGKEFQTGSPKMLMKKWDATEY